MNPVATVNGLGLNEFLSLAMLFLTSELTKMYEQEKSHMNHAIADVSNYALTTDIWSTYAMRAHFIDANFSLCIYLLNVIGQLQRQIYPMFLLNKNL